MIHVYTMSRIPYSDSALSINEQIGFGFQLYRGNPMIRGNGFFGSLFSKIVPMVRAITRPAGRAILDAGKKAAIDGVSSAVRSGARSIRKFMRKKTYKKLENETPRKGSKSHKVRKQKPAKKRSSSGDLPEELAPLLENQH